MPLGDERLLKGGDYPEGCLCFLLFHRSIRVEVAADYTDGRRCFEPEHVKYAKESLTSFWQKHGGQKMAKN
jgi:hypothetical protein